MARRFKGFGLGLAIGMGGLLLCLSPLASELEEDLGLLWLFKLRGAIAPPADVVVVALDAQSADELGLPRKTSAWPRHLHAELIKVLVEAKAQVIAFDLIFETPSPDPGHDRQFSTAIGTAGNVVLLEVLKTETAPPADKAASTPEQLAIEKRILPLSILAESALAHAPFPLPKASRVNAYWAFKSEAGDCPTLPVMALQVYALQAYDELLNLWRRLAPTGSFALPGAKDPAQDRIEAMSSTLRHALMTDPQLAAEMLKELDRASEQTIAPSKKRIIEALLNLYLSGEVHYLNFYGPARTITTLPYSRVLQLSQSTNLEGALNPDAFRGKAVFVGFSAALQAEQDQTRDDYRTVFSQASGLDIAGVEIAATAFANLLENRPVRALSLGSQVVIVLFWGMAIGICCRRLRARPAMALAALASGAYLFGAFYSFKAWSIWLPLVVPLFFQAPIALFGAVAARYREARSERERIKRAFGYFLPSTVVEQLTSHVGPITSANREVFGVCLATDVEHYTTLAEKMGPTQLSLLMNEYFAALFGPVERHGGIVSDVVGDAMLAIWAGASPDPSLRGQACRAALEIAATLAQFNRSSNRPALPTRIGLHSGRMLLGSVGAAHHYEYRAVGDIVNTASRIEALGKHLGVRLMVSEDVLEGLDDFLARPLGRFVLAGKSTAVRVFELLGQKSAAQQRQISLCSEFETALHTYATAQWHAGAVAFSRILDAFPGDGPARFYLDRCKRFAIAPPGASWDSAVHMESK